MPRQRLRFTAKPNRCTGLGLHGMGQRRWHYDPESELGQRSTKQRDRRIHVDFRVSGVTDGSHPGMALLLNFFGSTITHNGMNCKGDVVEGSSAPEFCIGERAMARCRRILAWD